MLKKIRMETESAEMSETKNSEGRRFSSRFFSNRNVFCRILSDTNCSSISTCIDRNYKNNNRRTKKPNLICERRNGDKKPGLFVRTTNFERNSFSFSVWKPGWLNTITKCVKNRFVSFFPSFVRSTLFQQNFGSIDDDRPTHRDPKSNFLSSDVPKSFQMSSRLTRCEYRLWSSNKSVVWWVKRSLRLILITEDDQDDKHRRESIVRPTMKFSEIFLRVSRTYQHVVRFSANRRERWTLFLIDFKESDF